MHVLHYPALMSRSVLTQPPEDRLGAFREALDGARVLLEKMNAAALVEAVADTERLKPLLWARLTSISTPQQQDEDRLVDVREASRRLCVSPSTLYRDASDLPFTVRVGRHVRFSARGITKFIAARRSL